jgi:hypothetical protein
MDLEVAVHSKFRIELGCRKRCRTWSPTHQPASGVKQAARLPGLHTGFSRVTARVQEVGSCIMEVMAQLDRQFTDSGKGTGSATSY